MVVGRHAQAGAGRQSGREDLGHGLPLSTLLPSADIADVEVAAAWDAVEDATRRAQALQAEADQLRAIAQGLALQPGFRRVP